jgi:hypothetical protein
MRHIIWRNRASAILGLLVMIMPFTGFPEATRDSLVVLFGFFIALFGFYYGGKTYRLEEEKISASPASTDSNVSPKRSKKHLDTKEEITIPDNESSN